MIDKSTKEFAYANAVYWECKVIEEFLEKTLQFLQNSVLVFNSTDEDITYVGLLMRSYLWAKNIHKSNDIWNFQAAYTASRSAFETAIDLTLLIKNPSEYPINQMINWEKSAKLNRAEKIVAFFNNPINVKYLHKKPKFYPDLINFINSEGSAIKANRRIPNGSHDINGWTGRHLKQNAEEADKVSNDCFVAFYEVYFSLQSWNVHGSTLTSIRTVSQQQVPSLSTVALKHFIEFVLISLRLIWDKYNLHDFDKYFHFNNIKQERVKILMQFFEQNYPDYYNELLESAIKNLCG